MKKFLAILMAMMLVFSLCGVAMADGYTDASTATLKKTYELEGSGKSPAETFTFSALTCTNVTDAAAGVTADKAPVPTIANSAVYTVGEAGSDTKTKSITINLPTYDSVGIYTYSFTEKVGNTAGVTYRSEPIKLVVTVLEINGKVRIAGVHAETGDGEKTDTFVNTYSAGSLSVTNEVKGILGDKTKEFEVTVTFTAPSGKTVNSVISYVDGTETKTIAANWTNNTATAKISLKDGETVIFNNIPYYVTYSVTEADYTGNNGGYDEAKITYGDTDQEIDSAAETVKVTNNKGGKVDTGVYTDNMPYIMLMGIVVLAGAVLLMKRRSYNG